jgi:hypothetical protein
MEIVSLGPAQRRAPPLGKFERVDAQATPAQMLAGLTGEKRKLLG